jgi:hypothetical protein
MRAADNHVCIGERHLVSRASSKREPLSLLAHAALVAQPARKLEIAELNWVWSIEKEAFDGPDNQQRN